jgi:hypothetical protein
VQISKVVIEEVIACSKNIEAMQGRQGAYVCASDFNGTTRALIATGAIPNPEKRRKYCRIAQKKCYDLALLDLLLVGRPSVKSTRAYADPEVERYVGGIVGASLVFATSGFTGDLDEVCSLGIAVGMNDLTREEAFQIAEQNPHKAILRRVLDMLAGYL